MAAPTPPPFTARVVAVTDGDTLKALTPDKRQIIVRLAEIDAPEAGQPYGRKSKRELSDLVFQRSVLVVPSNIDRYGRVVAQVRLDRRDVATEMVRRGAAWVYLAYSRDRALPVVEASARSTGAGLWALPASERLPPWEWRKARRAGDVRTVRARPTPGSRIGRPALVAATGPSCSARRVCAQMSSCDEAVYHLRTCGQRHLDGDHDGKPCEKLCR